MIAPTVQYHFLFVKTLLEPLRVDPKSIFYYYEYRPAELLHFRLPLLPNISLIRNRFSLGYRPNDKSRMLVIILRL